MEGWKKALLYAGGAGGVAALLYWLLREEPEGEPDSAGAAASEEDGRKKMQAEGVSKEQVLLILNEMVESQQRMRGHMKDLTAKLLEKNMDFEETYEQVRSLQPDDPLERHGLSMADFDQMLAKHSSDPQVMQGVTQIMGVADLNKPSGRLKPVSEDQVIEVHAFMLQELKGFLGTFSEVKGKRSWDMKTVTLASQAIVAAKVEEKYKLSSEEIERAVMQNHTTLATNQEFAQINMNMQETMASLMAPGGP